MQKQFIFKNEREKLRLWILYDKHSIKMQYRDFKIDGGDKLIKTLSKTTFFLSNITH